MEVGGDWFGARDEQCFGREQGEPSKPAVNGEWAQAASAEISEQEEHDCGGGEQEADSCAGVWHEREGRGAPVHDNAERCERTKEHSQECGCATGTTE